MTSFTIFAPASSAAAATSAFEVSIEISASPASSLITGITRRFSSAADVEDISAVSDYFSGLGECLRNLKKSATVGKGIRRHVQDAHDPAAGGEIENLARDFPSRHTHMGETTTRHELFEAMPLIDAEGVYLCE